MAKLEISNFKKADLSRCKSCNELVIKSFDKDLKDCNYFFMSYNNLEEVVIENWSNVVNCNNMFSLCKNLEKIEIPADSEKITAHFLLADSKNGITVHYDGTAELYKKWDLTDDVIVINSTGEAIRSIFN